MQGVAEMFREFDGYDRYEIDVYTWCLARAERGFTSRYRTEESYREAHKEKTRQYHYVKRGLPVAARRPVPTHTHGDYRTYALGCRCVTCKAGVAARRRAEYAARIGRKPRAYKRAA